jgi:hypothetical protein
LSLCLINESSRHGDVWRSGGIAAPLLISALDEDELSTSLPNRFNPRARAICTHWIGGWVGPRAGLDSVQHTIMYFPCQESNPARPARSPSLYRLSYSGSTKMRKQKFFSTSLRPDRLWGPPNLLHIGYFGSIF